MKGFAIEELATPAPYGSEVFGELGLRGISCGSGTVLRDGCLNVDRIQLQDGTGNTSRPGALTCVQSGDRKVYYLEHDLTQALPLRDGAFEWGYSEHFIEHVPLQQAVNWLAEMRRVIRPGGLLRLSTPDLQKYMEGYLDPEGRFFKTHRQRIESTSKFNKGPVPSRRAWMVNQIFRFYEHQWIYDFDEICYAATSAGFSGDKIVRENFQTGALEDVAMLDSPSRNDETIYVEMIV